MIEQAEGPMTPEDEPKERERRSKHRPTPELPSGYRASRRGSKAARQAKRAIRQHKVVEGMDSVGRTTRNAAFVGLMGVGAVVFVLVALLVAAVSVNALARWNAKRIAARHDAPTQAELKARENVLLISVKSGKATGFLAVRVDDKQNQIFGIAIPDGAFIEVPGQGFERVGDSYLAGPDVSMSAISNFLSVTFNRYVVVPEATYQKALQEQTMKDVMKAAIKSNLSAADTADLTKSFNDTPTEDVALVPLTVKPITLGSETYFEPQRKELIDLVESWWGVKMSEADNVVRLIVYNGAGTPGVAGEAAQQLIRGGFRVVDTKNADNFNYKQTQIVVQDKDMAAGDAVRKVLGVGKVIDQVSDQDVADVIVIIGKDYKPPKSGS
jgi:hypothetical protein